MVNPCLCPEPEVVGEKCAKCGGINPKVAPKKERSKKKIKEARHSSQP